MGTELIPYPAPPALQVVRQSTMIGFAGVTDKRVLGTAYPEARIVNAIRSARDAEGGAKVGDFRIAKKVYPLLDVLVLKVHSFRALQEGPPERKRTVCASSDALRPLARLGRGVRNPDCPSCDYAQWQEPLRPGGRNVPPACRTGLAFFCVLPHEHYAPFWLACIKGRYRHAQEFVQTMTSTPGAQHPAQFRVHIRNIEESWEGKVWQAPIFTIVQEYPVEQYLALAQAADGPGGPWYEPWVDGATTEPIDGDEPIDVSPVGNGNSSLDGSL